MQTLKEVADLFLHLDKHLVAFTATYGGWTYALLFLIVFCETGLVVTPFLPGDSLLFATGALAASGGLNVHVAALLLMIAAILGDALNYAIGARVGLSAFGVPGPDGRAPERNALVSTLFKREYLERTQAFYGRYGGKTIIFARFVPIVRTFAPFLAGVGEMSYPTFAAYNIAGAVLWVVLFVYGGYLFGTLPAVKENFTLVVLAIIVVSVLPAVVEAVRAKREHRRAA